MKSGPVCTCLDFRFSLLGEMLAKVKPSIVCKHFYIYCILSGPSVQHTSNFVYSSQEYSLYIMTAVVLKHMV